MGLFRKIFGNTRKPEGFFGKMMAKGMNGGAHEKLAVWGFSHIRLKGDEQAADFGCGGGGNVSRLLAMLPEGRVAGLDYSEVSVETSRKTNQAAIEAGRCRIVQGNVRQTPFQDEEFDVVTAFETVYFWPELESCFREVRRVLKDGGFFMITNESDGKNARSLKWKDKIDGMEIYTADQLRALLEAAGFSGVTTDDDEAGDRLCVIAYK